MSSEDTNTTLWLYHFKGATFQKDGKAGIQKVYARPTWKENNETMTSGIVELHVMAADFLTSEQTLSQLNDEEIRFNHERIQHLSTKDYFIEEKEVTSKQTYLNRADLLVQQHFTKEELVTWLRLYLTLRGYPTDQMEETDFSAFAADLNPIFQLFSLNNVEKFESELGEKWWEGKDTPSRPGHTIDDLLKELGIKKSD